MSDVRVVSPGASTTAKIALAIAIIALVLIIGFGIWWFYSRSKDVNNPTWRSATAVTSGTTDTFTPSGDDIYIVSSNTALVLTISAPSTSDLKGAMFIVNNTTNTNAITVVKGTGVTSTIPAIITIAAGTSAQFMWTAKDQFRRISPFN